MTKSAVLIIGVFLLAACDATPKGNKSIMPVEHEESVEHVDHHGHHEAEEQGEEEISTAETDSTRNAAAEVPVTEPAPRDSAQ